MVVSVDWDVNGDVATDLEAGGSAIVGAWLCCAHLMSGTS